MTLLDNTITGKTSSSHCGPLKLQIQIAKIRSKNTVKNEKLKMTKVKSKERHTFLIITNKNLFIVNILSFSAPLVLISDKRE